MVSLSNHAVSAVSAVMSFLHTLRQPTPEIPARLT